MGDGLTVWVVVLGFSVFLVLGFPVFFRAASVCMKVCRTLEQQVQFGSSC